MISRVEYIWLDGRMPTKGLRNKTKILEFKKSKIDIRDFPDWTFDGSSTYQALGGRSDLVLRPVRVVLDPFRSQDDFLVLCEVFDIEGQPVSSNTRAHLRNVLEKQGSSLDAWFGFEQEYTLFKNGRPLGWPQSGYPEAQGPFYCGVGADRSFGREMVEAHMNLSLNAGLMLFGINAEVMPAQWEFQIGHRGFSGENADPLTTSDHLWLSRWLLHRVAEEFDVVVSFDNKPMKGDWNGAGCHTNFSTKNMRDKKTGPKAIESLLKTLEARHQLHIKSYGHGLSERLTGHHETCDINTFKAGFSDRGASIRIPHFANKNYLGYIEDRRPGANCDPYLVSALLMEAAVLSENGKAKIVKKTKASLLSL